MHFPKVYHLFFLKPYIDSVHKWPNACVVPPHSRLLRQESACITTETIMAGNYAKITARGCGQYQRFVSAAMCPTDT
jgi:hypothetical protein